MEIMVFKEILNILFKQKVNIAVLVIGAIVGFMFNIYYTKPYSEVYKRDFEHLEVRTQSQAVLIKEKDVALMSLRAKIKNQEINET